MTNDSWFRVNLWLIQSYLNATTGIGSLKKFGLLTITDKKLYDVFFALPFN